MYLCPLLHPNEWKMTKKTFHNLTMLCAGLAITYQLIYRLRIEYTLYQKQFFKDAMKMLRANQESVNILGSPIFDVSIDLENPRNYIYNYSAHYEIPVVGLKQSGVLYFWANRTDRESAWELTKVELVVRAENIKVVIKDELTHTSNSQDTPPYVRQLFIRPPSIKV